MGVPFAWFSMAVTNLRLSTWLLHTKFGFSSFVDHRNVSNFETSGRSMPQRTQFLRCAVGKYTSKAITALFLLQSNLFCQIEWTKRTRRLHCMSCNAECHYNTAQGKITWYRKSQLFQTFSILFHSRFPATLRTCLAVSLEVHIYERSARLILNFHH